jgi:hypothetical protein
MITVFAEYKVMQTRQREYLLAMQHTSEQLRKHPSVLAYQLKEAVDQPDLFVEVMEIADLNVYHEWKKQLAAAPDESPWSGIFPYLYGGRAKFHLWAFQEVPVAKYRGNH